MTATSNILITAKDLTGQAFASANSNLNGFASNALKASTALSAIGAGTVVASMAAFTRQTIDAQDNLSKLSQKTGIAVESLAGLEFAAEQSGVELDKVAKATRAFSLLVAESADASGEAAKKLGQLGLSYKDLKDLSPEKQLLSLADALSKFGKEDRAVALTSLLGNKMADLIPLLSGGSKELAGMIEQGKKLNPVTEQSAKQAELFNDQLNLLSKSVSAVGREFVQGMIPGLSAVADRMAKVTQESGFLKGALAGVKELFVQSFGNPKILGDVGQIRREIFKTQEVIANLSAKKDSVFFDKNALEHEKDKLAQLQIDLQAAIVKSRDVIAAQDANTESTKKFAVALEDTTPKIGKQVSAQDLLNKAQQESLRINSEYIKLLNIERKAREDLLKPYQQEAKSAEDRLDRMRQEAIALDLSQRKQISLEQAIELTTISRLEEKRAATKDPGIVIEIEREIAARKQIIEVIKTSEDRTKQLKNVTANTTDEVSQLWMQAGRNIQSALANGIFNFFDDGLKGMVRSVASTVGRIASEFAALKIAQGVGLAGMFGSGAAMAGSTGGTGSNALSLASMGTSAVSMMRGGFGLNGLVGSGLSTIGGSGLLGSFGAGLSGGSQAAAFIGAESATAGAGAVAGLGSSLGAVAGPAIALFAANALAQYIAGNKTFGNKFTDTLQKIPILGIGANLAAALFGHGPLKFRQQSIQGTASSEGFDGDIRNVFRAKGGLLVGNKHKTVTEQFTVEQQTLFDNTLKSFYGSAHKFAENLGLSTALVDGFTKDISIVSEKGKQVTEEAIADMLRGIGNSLAENALPIVATFRKAGEDSFATFSRLNTEFVSLDQAAQNLGASAEYARQLISGMSIQARTAFVDKAGGTDTLLQQSAFFFNNFLSDGEKAKLSFDLLATELGKLGLAADITKDQYKELVQSANTSDELRIGLLNLQEQFINTKAATEALSKTQEEHERVLETQRKAALSDNLNKSFSGLQKSVDVERQKATDRFNDALKLVNDRITDVTDNVQKLTTLNNALKSTLSTLNPLSLDEARAKIQEAITSSKSGKVVELDNISDALNKLAQSDSSGFSTRNEFLRSQAKSASLVGGLSDATNKQLTVEERSLNALIANRDRLERGFNDEMTRLDALVSAAQTEINVINGLDTTIKSLIDAIGSFNSSAIGSGGTPIDMPGAISGGNPNITSKDIVNFANTHTPIETYKKARELGVSSDQIVASGKYTRAEIDKFVKDNKLASFDVGGIVPKTGLALVHKGEQVINPQQKDKIIATLERLIEAVNKGTGASSDTFKMLRDMSIDGRMLRTAAA